MATWNPVTVNFSDANTAMAHGVNTIANVGDAAKSYVKDLEEKAKEAKAEKLRVLASDATMLSSRALEQARSGLHSNPNQAIASVQTAGSNNKASIAQQQSVGSPYFKKVLTGYVDVNGNQVSPKDAFNVTTGKLNTGVAQQPVSAQAQTSNAQQQLLQSGSPKLITAKDVLSKKENSDLPQFLTVDPKTKGITGFNSTADIKSKITNYYTQTNGGKPVPQQLIDSKVADVQKRLKLAFDNVGKYQMSDGSLIDQKKFNEYSANEQAIKSGKMTLDPVRATNGGISKITVDLKNALIKDPKTGKYSVKSDQSLGDMVNATRESSNTEDRDSLRPIAFIKNLVSPGTAGDLNKGAEALMSNIKGTLDQRSANDREKSGREYDTNIGIAAARVNRDSFMNLKSNAQKLADKLNAGENPASINTQQSLAPATKAEVAKSDAKTIKTLKDGLKPVFKEIMVTPKATALQQKTAVATVVNTVQALSAQPTTKENKVAQFNILDEMDKKINAAPDEETKNLMKQAFASVLPGYYNTLSEIDKTKFQQMMDLKNYDLNVIKTNNDTIKTQADIAYNRDMLGLKKAELSIAANSKSKGPTYGEANTRLGKIEENKKDLAKMYNDAFKPMQGKDYHNLSKSEKGVVLDIVNRNISTIRATAQGLGIDPNQFQFQSGVK